MTALAVDANLGYLFVASEVTKEGDYESTDVYRYNFTVDATTNPSATLTVNSATKKHLLSAKEIKSLAIDAD